ncbi:hypothetical protein [Lentzea nigeriaca]|uniref:hypothetical protein n=1 Tax=Lentzea nigeriaca TaxID=1128665 RepID=UPI00195AE8CF|nr:hypothetical protein [Lentzea nigeriaca]MBM7860554.1 hypothetical protein [Lentzea nigeriaca]
MAARGETQANVEVSTLVVPAWRLRWRAPELALVLGERALALASARHDEADRLRAESLVVFAGNRVGRGVRIADRAIDALKAAEAAGEYETAWLLRVELAACARSVGAPLTGFAAVTPVLEAPDVSAELRASALVQASECLVTVGRGDEPTRALAEADQLYVADTTLDDDTRLLLRGLIRAVQAAQHRRWGDIAAAIGAAREGLDLLGRFADPSADSGQGLGRLTLELVLALMDANRLLDASEVGTPMLDRPVRAPSASTTGWLQLALATRVHLPAGRVAVAREMLREAAASAERHQLDTLLAESLLALAHVNEVSGELSEALTNLRAAHAAERRRARAVYAVRARLAAEFSGVHRQPADLHQQLASLLRPFDGMQMVTDGVLSAALKQQLRQWRPVQVRKGDGLKVKRVRRAAEDMTVEGLSAARQHAADRWRMVQPFGEPDDKTPDPVEPQPPAAPSSDRTVPASGLIASAGAMVSGRRRAARVAAGEIEDDQPTPPSPTPTSAPAETPALSPEQERKRKVEQQLMELQREARRQIEAERQARAEQRAAAEREAAEEAARQAAAREEAARQAAAREEAARQAAAREEVARQESARQEAARGAAAREGAAGAQPESVMDMLKAQGLRAGGRRRAPETESQPGTPSWRVEPPSRLRQDDPAENSQPQQDFFAGAQSAPGDRAAPTSSADPDTPSRSNLAAAFSRPPATPDFGPHLDDPTPAYPLHTPAGGFPTTPSDSSFGTPQWSTSSIPSPAPTDPPDPTQPPDPERKPLPPLPDPIPSVPTPDEIPQPPEPDLLSSTFLSSADVEPEDDTSTLPTTPIRAATSDQPTFGAHPDAETERGFSAVPPFGTGPDHGSGDQPTFGTPTGFGTQPTFGTQTFGAQPTFGNQTSFGTQPTFGTQTGFGAQPEPTAPQPDSSPQADPADTAPDRANQPDPAAWLNFEIAPDYDVASNLVMLTGPSTTPDSATDPDPTPGPTTRAEFDQAASPGSDTSAGFDPAGPAAGVAFGSAESAGSAMGGFGAATSADAGDAGFGSAASAASAMGAGFGSVVSSDASAGAGFGSAASADSADGAGFGSASSAGVGSAASADAAGGTGFGSAAESSSAPEYDFFATESASATHPDPVQFGGADTQSRDTAAEPSPATPTGTEQPEAKSESGTRTGRPSSRRKPSDLSLADLLAEALVAYETGRRSDEEQLQASEPATSEWSAETGRSDAPDQSYSVQPPAEAGQPSSTDSLFDPGQTGSAVGDSLYQPGLSFGAQQPATDDSLFRTGLSFGSPQPEPGYFLPEQPSTEPEAQPQESEQEKTGPIVPVGATPDNETTGPIRPVRPDGPAGWTLPGT